MQREPTPADIAVIDDMITKMSDAKPYELPNAVSRAMRVVSSPQFFLRIAERADGTSDPEEKEKLGAFADNLVNTIRAVVSVTEDSLNERAADVEKVVKAASEPESGEFLVPLSADRIDAMRVEMEGLEAEDLNEGFLSTIDSWMNKAHQVS
jgi:alpha-L-fucosidase